LKNAFASDSLIVDSWIPILKSPRSVLTIYNASIGEAETNNSVIRINFFSIVPSPSSSGSFLKFSITLSVVRWDLRNNVDCFFVLISF